MLRYVDTLPNIKKLSTCVFIFYFHKDFFLSINMKNIFLFTDPLMVAVNTFPVDLMR